MDKHYENLTKLYLRLKGYLVSNLIIHSDQKGTARSEVDIVGVRMPFHLQEYRWVNVEDYLECSTSSIEIIIGDVKNITSLENVEFNKGLRRDPESIKQLVNWLGMFESIDNVVLKKFEHFLNLHRLTDLNGFAAFEENLSVGKFTFKFTFFCPSLPKWNGKGFKYIHGEEIINFIWECLNIKEIETCSRTYNFVHWNEFEAYVRFFKNSENKVTKEDFEQYFNNL